MGVVRGAAQGAEVNKGVLCSVASVLSASLRPYGLKPARLLCPWDYLGKNTGMGCPGLLQRIFPTRDQTYVSDLLHWQVGPLPLVPPGKPNTGVISGKLS